MTSSGWSGQRSQDALVMNFLRARLLFVGNESEHALHKKCLTLFGILSFQMLVQKFLSINGFEGPGWLLFAVLDSNWYADFMEYTQFFVSFCILQSTGLLELNGILRISRASKGRNSSLIRSSSQLDPFLVIKVHTLVFIGKCFWGERTLL